MTNALFPYLKKKLRNIRFLRYEVAPAVRRVYFEWRRLRAEKSSFPAITDMKAGASCRNWKYVAAAPTVIQHSVPSRCLPEDALEIVRHSANMLRKHDRHKENPDFLYQMLFANLFSVKRYPVYETFTCEVPDVFIGVPDGPVLTSQFEALIQSSRMNWQKVLMDHVPAPGSQLKGQYVSLLGWSGRDYGHWLIDILTRIALLKEGYSDLLFLVAEPLQGYMWQSLDLLGITRDQVVPVTAGWYRLESLLACHAAQRYTVPKREHLLELTSRLIRGAWGSETLPAPWRSVYVSRNKSRRKITNEQDILPVLREYGFEPVYAEDLSLKDQIRLFNETRVVLGPHGAGMNNDIFCQPGAVVVELYNPVRYNWCVREVANIMGHEHWFMFGNNVNNDYDMTVNSNKLEKLLAYVFDRGDIVESVY